MNNEIIELFLNENLANLLIELTQTADGARNSDYGIEWIKDNNSLKIGITKDGRYYLNYIIDNNNKYKKVIEDFKQFAESLDGDIFLAACEEYTRAYGKNSLSEFSEMINEAKEDPTEQINNFKECVKVVVNNIIKALTVLIEYLND